MGYIVSDCPVCGKKNRAACNAWVYGSPIRQCPFCHAEYLDSRWREVAIEGFDPRSSNSKLYLAGTLGSAAFAAVMAFWVHTSIRMSDSYSIRAAGCIWLGVMTCILCLIMFIRIKCGYEEKSQAPFLEESRARMQDPAYVRKLMQYGIEVPEEFLPKEQDA